MSYKTILVHADQTTHAGSRMTLAARLARACDAHLCALACSGLSRYAQADDPSHPRPLVPQQLALWHARARASLEALQAIAAHAGLAPPSLYLLEDDPEAALMRRAAGCDLVVLSQTDPHDASPGAIRDLPQNLLLHCGRPLLLVPCSDDGRGPPGAPFRHALLAWDGSGHAARAFSDALPLLKLADTVTLLMLNADPGPDRHGMEPGADMARWLARHGVAVELMRQLTSVDIGDALLGVAGEQRCDLLVMGGYGHRRAREALLGGATRTVLKQMTLPVLIAH